MFSKLFDISIDFMLNNLVCDSSCFPNFQFYLFASSQHYDQTCVLTFVIEKLLILTENAV